MELSTSWRIAVSERHNRIGISMEINRLLPRRWLAWLVCWRFRPFNCRDFLLFHLAVGEAKPSLTAEVTKSFLSSNFCVGWPAYCAILPKTMMRSKFVTPLSQICPQLKHPRRLSLNQPSPSAKDSKRRNWMRIFFPIPPNIYKKSFHRFTKHFFSGFERIFTKSFFVVSAALHATNAHRSRQSFAPPRSDTQISKKFRTIKLQRKQTFRRLFYQITKHE